MARGDKKRKASGCFFKKGHKIRRVLKYLPPHQASDDSHHSTQTGCEDLCSRHELRPRNLQIEEDAVTGNRIINVTQLLSMMNTLCASHLHTSCKQPDFELHSEIKVGLGSKITFRCKACDYISARMRTHEEIQNTRKAAINTLLAAALMDTPMGISRAEQLFTQLDIPFPATSHLHKLTAAVSEEMVKMNHEDMSDKRRIVEQRITETGARDPKQLDLSIDARYNSSRMTSSYKPGQSSSQAYTVAIENHTDKKYVIGLAVENKLCWTGAMLKNKGVPVDCPGGHAGCTANLQYFTAHSERRMAYDLAEGLSLEGYFVRTLTTDGDSRSHLGMQDFYKKLDIAWDVSRQADPNHLAVTQERKLRSASFSSGMFSETTNVARKKAQGVLARDIKARCNAIVEEMTRLGQGDITKYISKLMDIRKATIECYAGNCSYCPESALVCGGEGSNCWWYKSHILGPNNLRELNMNENDKSLLAVILQMRLSEEAVYKVSSRTSTQKCEAFNRAALATLSKAQNYSRTFGGRLALLTMRANNSVETVVKKKLLRMTSLRLSRNVQKRLRHISTRAHYHKAYKSTRYYKAKRIRRRAEMEFEHRHAKEMQTGKETDYLKGVLDSNLHAYCKS